MSFSNLLSFYDQEEKNVLFKQVENEKLLTLADSIEKFRLEIQNRYENDGHLLEALNVFKKMFFRLVSSLFPYNKTINPDSEKEILSNFYQIKNSYPELFSNIVIDIAKAFREVTEITSNNLRDFLHEYINNRAEAGLRIAIVTKRAISIDERYLFQSELKPFLKISYYTENSFRKDLEFFDEVIYIGTPSYFGEYVKNTFKGKTNTFISYDLFPNYISPKHLFEDISNKDIYSTVYEKVTFGKTMGKKSKLNLEEKDSLDRTVSRYLEEQKNGEENPQDMIEASIVYLENDRFLFAPRDSKIRTFSLHDKSNYIKQINFNDVEEDDFIVIRNDRDTKLIAEVADQDILKSKASIYRIIQNEWKNKLRIKVEEKGLKRVSRILTEKYHLITSSIASVRSWCNEESICPNELPKILKALKYEETKIKEIYSCMREIQLAHRKAGRIISKKLMNELSNDMNIFKELQEKGYYTFMSSEFQGASFNIERIISINRKKCLVAPHNLMKPMNVD
ncbi:hypothetical protein [Bacillus infantis]|uniref:Uncharacterized protein n=1 Tax=Bacillus infantis TaxID=324767 RepID=A0A5D4RK48_9BACI|nr:hypothetical protein [Bacillus infantis]TYS51189.1 hypothetical protein FZD51_03880 [Bacillus infantis]